MKVVRLSSSRTGHLYPQEMFLVLTFTRGWADPRAMVWSEGICHWKNPVTPPGIDPGTVWRVAQCLNHHATPGPSVVTSIPTKCKRIIAILQTIMDCARVPAVSRWPVTVEAQVWSQASPYRICVGQGSIGTGFSPLSAAFHQLPIPIHSYITYTT